MPNKSIEQIAKDYQNAYKKITGRVVICGGTGYCRGLLKSVRGVPTGNGKTPRRLLFANYQRLPRKLFKHERLPRFLCHGAAG